VASRDADGRQAFQRLQLGAAGHNLGRGFDHLPGMHLFECDGLHIRMLTAVRLSGHCLFVCLALAPPEGPFCCFSRHEIFFAPWWTFTSRFNAINETISGSMFCRSDLFTTSAL